MSVAPLLIIGMPFVLGSTAFVLSLRYGDGGRGGRIRLYGAPARRPA